jgi:hypothetical protein
MSAKVTIEGLAEFKEALHHLPDTLKAEAGHIVIAAAEEAKRTVQAAYPQGPTGNLKRGVTMSVESASSFGVAARVKSGAKHAFIFENGTVARQTRAGANRGRMPKAPDSERMIPIVIRIRRKMTAQLIDLVQKAGFVVTQG